ncbi:hypothetical protein THRCLA_22751 [Thraustotheca clavata]|uniref:Uncharacterized protein n=1 Tax=Thraustotheca clavata TaxID=74557 RepID=A0A1V9YU25_9STRA|nr:hypothetical protein THRCLA_22751 [Thraustotheca clavata]
MSTSTPRSDLLCKYTYKPCNNPRTTKKNGDLHMLCTHHRNRANEVQKTHAMKRKLIKALDKATQSLSAFSPTSASSSSAQLKKSESMDVLELEYLESLLEQHDAHEMYETPTMTEEEYAILFELF